MMSSFNRLPTNLKGPAMVAVFALVLAACGGAASSGAADAATTSDAGSQASSAENVETDTTADSTSSASTVEVSVETHSDASDFEWDESGVVDIVLEGESIAVDSSAVTVNGATATITAGGTYRLSGELSDGEIIVDSQDETLVQLILDGVSVASSTGPAIGVASADEVAVILTEGSENTLTDASSYSNPYVEANLDAALVSTADMSIGGTGSLTVVGNYNDAISSSDGLVIVSGDITVDAIDDGIRGKDYLIVEDGTFTVTAGGDGFKSDNGEDASRGYISILGGGFKIDSVGDAIAAETVLTIAAGDFVVTTSGDGDVDSAKGLKAGVTLSISDGTFVLDTIDDAVHSNGSITIDGGDFEIATGDDAMHADATLTVNDGSIEVTESYEGLESAVITLNGGDIDIVSSDDGINISGGNDGSGQEGGFGGRPRGGGDQFAASEDQWLYINGGSVVINAGGDGIDVNGYWAMTGGTVVIHGPTENMNGALDVNGTFEISGGFLVAAGSAGMAESPEASSEQAFLSVQFNGTQTGAIQIQDSSGNAVLTFEPKKSYQAFVFSSPDLVAGDTYEFYMGGQGSGENVGGVYQSSADAGTSVGSATAT